MPCYRCGRVQEDPAKGASPWARGVIVDEQILICPDCQQRHREWTTDLRRCAVCGSTRLQIQIGMIVCRQCGDAVEVRPGEASF